MKTWQDSDLRAWQNHRRIKRGWLLWLYFFLDHPISQDVINILLQTQQSCPSCAAFLRMEYESGSIPTPSALAITSHSSAAWQLPLSMEILTSRMRRNGLAAEGRFKWVIMKRVLQHWNRLPRRTVESPQGSVQNTVGMQHLGIRFSGKHLDLMILEVFFNP